MSEERLRRDARACLAAGIEAVEPGRLVARFLAAWKEPGAPAERVRVVAIGKAAAAMARAAGEALGPRISDGVVILPAAQISEAPSGFDVFGGGHPVPNAEGVAGSRAVLELTRGAGPRDLVLCLVSGGGSALMTLPPAEIELEEIRRLTGELLRAGASIGELNAVRKHLDRLKGGRLAREAAPARVLALVLSDVVGDPLDVIASGPVSPDPTTYSEAIAVLTRHGVWESAAPAIRAHLERGLAGLEAESPSAGDPCFDAVEIHVVGSNRLAAAAAVAEAGRLGYSALSLGVAVTGEARVVGRELALRALECRRGSAPPERPACLVSAGETTVTVRGHGRGGRNQELALGAALALDGHTGVLVASAGTDGIDGPTDAAGALVTGETLPRARELGLDPEGALAGNDSYPFFRALGDLIVTGPTGTNVMDLQIALVL